MVVAYKWLAELYGLLCKDKNEMKLYKPKLEKALKSAVKYSDMNNAVDRSQPNDVHLQYLITKFNCRVIFLFLHILFLILLMKQL